MQGLSATLLSDQPFDLSISNGVEPCARVPWEWGTLLGWTSLLWFTIFLIDAFPVSLVTYPALCLSLTHDNFLILGGDALLCPPRYCDPWVSVPLCLLWSWLPHALQARVGRRHSTQAAEHVIPFLTQGGRGE